MKAVEIAGVAAVVTGGTSGLGRAVVRALRAAGARVALFARDREAGERVAVEEDALCCPCDVTADESVAAAFARARAAHGQERILVCCHGGAVARRVVSRDPNSGAVRIHPSEEFERILALNAGGTFRCVAQSAAGMLELPLLGEERGAVVLTSSLAAVEGQVGQAAYAAGKAAINGMTLVLARDLAREAIRVNTVQPGLFDTPAMRRAPPEFLAAMGRRAPFPNRLGRAEEFAHLVLALIRNPYANGAVVRLDGALRMEPR